jgi:hypothetical protein
MTAKNKFICPVCGFDGLREAPFDEHAAPSYEICPCCGFEFGFDDASSKAMADYRRKWMEAGCKWFIEKSKSVRWNLKRQLRNLE